MSVRQEAWLAIAAVGVPVWILAFIFMLAGDASARSAVAEIPIALAVLGAIIWISVPRDA